MTDTEALYFKSPMDAVITLCELFASSDWITVARYYDLSGSDIKREDLVSGQFFGKDNPPPVPPFLGKVGIRRPFTPGFQYERHTPDGHDTIRVYLKMEIDQGDGMVQRALSAFRMRKSERGYQVLPDEVSYFDEN